MACEQLAWIQWEDENWVLNIHREYEGPHSCPHGMGPRDMAPRDMGLHNVAPLGGRVLDNVALLDGRSLHNMGPH